MAAEALVQDQAAPSIEVGKGSIVITDSRTKETIAATYFNRIGGAQHPDKKLVVNKFDVMKAYENQGYGKVLMDEVKKLLVSEARVGYLSVHADNMNAQGFYESQGWEFDDGGADALPHAGQRASNLQLWMVYDAHLR
jgi:GNAT superfamily N-acetyltransferase